MNNDALVHGTINPNQKKPTFKEEVIETVKFVIIALIIVIPIRMYVAQPFIVSGASMDPTFESKQYLIVDEISYHLGDPERGDVVIFRYPKNPEQYFIKRAIGLPGETVTVDERGVVVIKKVDGTTFTMNEPYIKYTKSDSVQTTLGPDEYFMMGDNRAGSFDSRAWGPVSRDKIVGRAFLRLYPVSDAAILPGEFKQNN